MALLVEDGRTPKKPGGFDVRSAVESALRDAKATGGGGVVDPAVVPLWVNRPAPRSGTSRWAVENAGVSQDEVMVDPSDFATEDTAKVAFLDLDDDQLAAFRHRAVQAGLADPDATKAELFGVWQQMVDETSAYNVSKGEDRDKWISPFEALDKLSMKRAAGDNAAAGVGGDLPFTGEKTQTDTSVQSFNRSTLASTAQQVLQDEFGRDPTESELKAYVTAVNKAAEANPVVTTTTGTYKKGDLVARDQQQSGGVDATQVIRDSVEDDPEAVAYQSAAEYYPLAMQALNSVVSL